MTIDINEISELTDILQTLLDDMPIKIKLEVELAIKNLREVKTLDDLLKIQDELEAISNMSNIDSFSRNEIMNVITAIEGLVNS